MLTITVDPKDPRPLVEQIVEEIRRQIVSRQIRPGTKIPSIRKLAQAYRISRFTVVEAYERLVALGCLEARRASGFFAVGPRTIAKQERDFDGPNEELVWFIRKLLEPTDGIMLASGSLPQAWLDEKVMRQVVNLTARKRGAPLIEFGSPLGYLPLREHLCVMLAEFGIAANASQIVLTQNGSQALELIIKQFVRAGHAVLVDDPGYYNLFGSLRLHGAKLVGVPRLPDGPDIEALEKIAAEHKPRIYFTQSVLHNPTGTDMSPHAVFRLLQLAEKHDFLVVEDDVFCDLQTKGSPRLAALDQLNRVIYVRSFSKTLSGSLRLGFIAARQAIASDLAVVKVLSSITSSLFVERVLYAALTEGHYRRHLGRIHKNLDDARRNVLQAFERARLQVFGQPSAGLYLWARFANIEDSLALANSPASKGFVLAPGVVFRPHSQRSAWLRFNVTTSNDARVFRWLEEMTHSSEKELTSSAPHCAIERQRQR
jgi:DNA-binding transcriptional MocR family regulator